MRSFSFLISSLTEGIDWQLVYYEVRWAWVTSEHMPFGRAVTVSIVLESLGISFQQWPLPFSEHLCPLTIFRVLTYMGSSPAPSWEESAFIGKCTLSTLFLYPGKCKGRSVLIPETAHVNCLH